MKISRKGETTETDEVVAYSKEGSIGIHKGDVGIVETGGWLHNYI
jgi:hypothetical protein